MVYAGCRPGMKCLKEVEATELGQGLFPDSGRVVMVLPRALYSLPCDILQRCHG